MPPIFKYNVYDEEGRIVLANTDKKDIAILTGVSAEYIDRQILHITYGQKEQFKGYTIECISDRTTSRPNTEVKKLLDAEWERTCRPFRALRRKKDGDDK